MSYKVNASQIKQARNFIKGTVRAVEKAQFRAVNAVASKQRTAASKDIRSQVRLPAAYVNQNLKVTEKANKNKPEAKISAKVRPTRLARYGAKQISRKAKAARGDSLRGIPVGKKQAGVSVAVKKGGKRAKMRKAFLVPLKNAGVMGVFVRTGSGKKDIKHIYGPSVSQLFDDYRKTAKDDIKSQLSSEYKKQLSFALQQEVKR